MIVWIFPILRAKGEESAAVVSRTLNERTNDRPALAKKLCYCILSQLPADPQLSLPLAAFQGAVVNIHEPYAPVAVVIRSVVTRRPVARKFVRKLPGRPRNAGREGMEFLSSFRNEGGLARAKTFWHGLKPMLIPMTPAKMCLVPIVMNREPNTKIILHEEKVSPVPRCGWSLIAMRTWMDGLCFFSLSRICHQIFGFNPCLDDSSARSPAYVACLAKHELCRAFCVATFNYLQYEEGYLKASPAVVSSAIASACLGAQEPLEECIEFRVPLREPAWNGNEISGIRILRAYERSSTSSNIHASQRWILVLGF